LKPAPAKGCHLEANTEDQASGGLACALSISVAQRLGVASRDRGRASRRRSPSDDIPLARRRPQPQAQTAATRLLSRSLPVALAVASATVLLLLGPLRPWLLPPPVAGLNARLSPDGRLLGHFPYPQAPEVSLVQIAPGLELRREAAEALTAMQRAAASEGVDLVVISAFRSVALQRRIFFDVGAERHQSATERAKVSAPPGYSEHSTGYAVDLGDGRNPSTNLSEQFENTAAFAWLRANAARFHFQLSFPADNRQGVSYEPWHWRFEGSTEALKLFDRAHRLSR
jgi:D-alanyl-D-alanine carboxypeptidase